MTEPHAHAPTPVNAEQGQTPGSPWEALYRSPLLHTFREANAFRSEELIRTASALSIQCRRPCHKAAAIHLALVGFRYHMWLEFPVAQYPHWTDAHGALLALIPPEEQAPLRKRKAVKALKQAYWERDHGPKDWQDVLPKKIVEWAYGLVRSLGLDCIDNVRVARVGIKSQNKRYKRDRDRGCCGFYDAIHTGPDGKRYHVGCNYGH